MDSYARVFEGYMIVAGKTSLSKKRVLWNIITATARRTVRIGPANIVDEMFGVRNDSLRLYPLNYGPIIYATRLYIRLASV